MVTSIDIEKLKKAIEIHDKYIGASSSFDEQNKQFFKEQSKTLLDFLISNKKINAYQLKTLKSELLTYWNESIKPETEFFWSELRSNNIDFERKEPLRFALTKKRFSSVEQGIDAKNHWNELKKLKSISDSYSLIEIDQLDRIIEADLKNRFSVLKKCLTKQSIPQSLYLKYGECMAYFANCKLFEKYFKLDEVEELYAIWKNFKAI